MVVYWASWVVGLSGSVSGQKDHLPNLLVVCLPSKVVCLGLYVVMNILPESHSQRANTSHIKSWGKEVNSMLRRVRVVISLPEKNIGW